MKIALKSLTHRWKVTVDHYQVITAAPEVDMYEGSYSVTPKVEEQTIPTARKYLLEDMQIKAIPMFETSNEQGGTTVYIANEV